MLMSNCEERVNIMKKVFCIFLVALMAFSFCTFASAGEYDIVPLTDIEDLVTIERNGVIYTLNTRYQTGDVSDALPSITGLVEIPAKVEYEGVKYDITRITVRAFEGCTGIEVIRIEEGVLGIEGYAFANCTGLEEAYFPDSIMSCAVTAFDGCGGVKLYAYAGSVESLEAMGNVEVIYQDGQLTADNFFEKLWESIVRFFERIFSIFKF